MSFMEMYLGMIEGLINAYRILLAIEEGKDSVELIKTNDDYDVYTSKK